MSSLKDMKKFRDLHLAPAVAASAEAGLMEIRICLGDFLSLRTPGSGNSSYPQLYTLPSPPPDRKGVCVRECGHVHAFRKT